MTSTSPATQREPSVIPAPWTRTVRPYAPPPPGAPCDLRLDANEGTPPPPDVIAEILGEFGNQTARYPRADALAADLAARLGVDPSRLLVTAGGDDAIDRACRVCLGPQRGLVLPVPTFEMFPRYAALQGAPVERVPWPAGPFPIDEVLARIGPHTGMVAVVSPNNPTGAVARADDLRRVARRARDFGAVVVADLAYAEFADEDLTVPALSEPNAVVIRTFSKAWGLAGLRVGYAAGPTDVIAWMRAAAGPYPVSSTSLAIARRWLQRGAAEVAASIERARLERRELVSLLNSLGARAEPSQGNFVLARCADARALADALAARAIAVRAFPGDDSLADALRITVPADRTAFDRLCRALRECLAGPGAVRGAIP